MSRDNQIEDISEDIFEGRLEVVDKRSGDKLKKASEVAREIIDILKSAGIDEWRYPVIAELKKKYFGKDTNVTTNTED